MKIICDNCRTKYSIADEKVKGKVFKIRCKKCSNIIVVRGNEPVGEEAHEAGAFGGGGEEYGEAPAWHLVIDQKQVGPMTANEVRERYSRGEIDSDTYIWREGFSDWMRVTQVDDFADIAQSTTVAPGVAPVQEQPRAWNADAGGEQWGGEPAEQRAAWDAQPAPASWSGEPSTDAGGAQNMFSAAAAAPAADPGRDLFGTADSGEGAFPASEPAADQGLFGSAGAMSAQPAAPAGDLFGGSNGGQQLFPKEEQPEPASQMTGARNENSVLFSLSNLQALAMGPGGAPISSSSAVPASGPSDGSGLIDIRSMAGVSPSPRRSKAMDDGLPDLGGYSAPIAAAPVLIPAVSDERPRWLLPTIVGGGVVLVGAIVALVLVLMLRKDPPVLMAAAPANPQVGQAVAGGGTATPPATGKVETPTPDPATKPEEQPTETKTARAPRHRPGRRKPGKKGEAHVASRASASDDLLGGSSKGSSKGPKAGSSRKHDALDDLIDGAVGSKKKKPNKPAAVAAAAPDSSLPETLTRAQIQAGMRNIKAKVQGCYDRYKVPGMANVQVKIARNGHVSSARVVGMFAGTPTGACVQAAAKSAQFEPFKGAPVTITYPFILR